MSTSSLNSTVTTSNVIESETGSVISATASVSLSTGSVATITDSIPVSSIVVSSSQDLSIVTRSASASASEISARSISSERAAVTTSDVSTTQSSSASISKQTNAASSSATTSSATTISSQGTTQNPAPSPAPAPSTSTVTTVISSGTTFSTSTVITITSPSPTSPVSTTPVSAKDSQTSSSVSRTQNSPSNNGQTQATTSLTSASSNEQQSSLRSVSPNQSAFASSASSLVSSTSSKASQTSSPDFSSSSSSSPSNNSRIVASTVAASVHVDSTLSSPVKVTVTSQGSTIVSTPDLITSTLIEGKTDGSVQTLTSVFANPTTSSQTDALSSTSFWNKKGAVAGVFLVVALVIIGSILGMICCIRRRRNRQLSSTSSGLLSASDFRRFSGPPPEMTEQPTTYQAIRNYGSSRDDPQRHLMAPSISNGSHNTHEDVLLPPGLGIHTSRQPNQVQSGSLNLTGVNTTYKDLHTYDGPFSDYHRYIATGDTRIHIPQRETIGIAYTSDLKHEPILETERVPEIVHRSPSPVPSSPSVYPPSLPPVPEKDDEDYLFYERETKPRPESRPPTRPSTAVGQDSDAKNPFTSPLDPTGDTSTKRVVPIQLQTEQTYRPITPPDSSSGHSPVISPGEQGTNKNPYSNAFLGRSVSVKGVEPLRPKRNPLRMSTSGSSVNL